MSFDIKAYMKKYRQKNRVRINEYNREYARLPRMKARAKLYHQRPEVIAREKLRIQSPEYKARRIIAQREYRMNPEVRKRQYLQHKGTVIERAGLHLRIGRLRERKARYESDGREVPPMLLSKLACFERLYELNFIERKSGIPTCIIKGALK